MYITAFRNYQPSFGSYVHMEDMLKRAREQEQKRKREETLRQIEEQAAIARKREMEQQITDAKQYFSEIAQEKPEQYLFQNNDFSELNQFILNDIPAADKGIMSNNEKPIETPAKNVPELKNHSENEEFELEQLEARRREAEKQQILRKQENIEEARKYYSDLLRDSLPDYNAQSTGMKKSAQFTLNLASSIVNDSDHRIEEFFVPEAEAQKLRENLSPDCQKRSIRIRDAIKDIEAYNDPVNALISANRMKDFIPDDAVLSNSQYKEAIDNAKKIYTLAVDNASKEAYSDGEKNLINELSGMIKKASGLDFGDEFNKKLDALIDSIKNRKRKFLPIKIENKVKVPKLKVTV
ncbi:hypothetical protein IJF81_03080 [bacterium]|nr:hypothetical protein [bacterium]